MMTQDAFRVNIQNETSDTYITKHSKKTENQCNIHSDVFNPGMSDNRRTYSTYSMKYVTVTCTCIIV